MAKEVKVGIIVALAIAITVLGLRWLASWRVGSTRYLAQVEFQDAGGLKKADRVLVHGVFKGRVDHVILTEDGVIVTVWLESDVVLKEDARAEVESIGFLGGARVLISPGRSETLYDFSRPIRGYSGMDLTKLIGRASEILVTTDTILKTISTSILSGDKLSRVDGIISTLEEATEDFKTSASELKTLLGDNREGLGRSIQQMERITENLDTLLVDLKDGEGTAGKLLADDDLYDELVGSLEEFKALVKDIKQHPKRYFSLF